MHALKLVDIGEELGIVLPHAVLARLGRSRGDVLFLTESADGWLLSTHDPLLQVQLEAGRQFVDEYRDTFRAMSE